MKIVYYADDGTEFNDRAECEEYENEQANARKNFKSHLYDEDGDEIFLDKIDEGGTIGFFDIKTQEDLQLLMEELADKRGLTMPDDTGRWFYNYDTDRWDSYEDYEELYLIMKKIFEREGK